MTLPRKLLFYSFSSLSLHYFLRSSLLIQNVKFSTFSPQYDIPSSSYESSPLSQSSPANMADMQLLLSSRKNTVENLLRRRYFFSPSFEIYGGSSGLYDLGPPGSALKNEIESLWRRHFIVHEEMLELTATSLTPYKVLKTSGHVDRFTDLLVRDLVTDETFRADKYLEDLLEGNIKVINQQQQEEKAMMAATALKTPSKSGEKAKKGASVKTPPTSTQSSNTAASGGAEGPLVGLCGIPEVDLLEDSRRQELLRLAGSYSTEELSRIFKDLKICSPAGNKLSDPYPFNLMFDTQLGAPGKEEGGDQASSLAVGTAFLRPETAQGIFVNFRRLLEFNRGKMPFGTAQLGSAFRNEISPRNGLLRVREFQMAEIEYFVHPEKKDHARFSEVSDVKLPLYSIKEQLEGLECRRDLTLREAVKDFGLINNESLGYFLARTYEFLIKCGINAECMRFRQHLPTEMAHYSSDCWDAEVLTGFGWVEVAGHADRSAYDLTAHSNATKIPLMASLPYDEPKLVEYTKFTPNKLALGKAFKKNQDVVRNAIQALSCEEKMKIETALNEKGTFTLKIAMSSVNEELNPGSGVAVSGESSSSTEKITEKQSHAADCSSEQGNGASSEDQELKKGEGKVKTISSFVLTREMMKFEVATKKVTEELFTPHVIEPSFGIGRILHCVLEHAYRERSSSNLPQGSEERSYLAIPPIVAPVKCSVLSISNNKAFNLLLERLCRLCRQLGISFKTDNSSTTIGKRYARTDELGIPFGITVDFQSVADDTVTLRERDSMQQVRLSVDEVVKVVESLVRGVRTWEDVCNEFPLFVEQAVPAGSEKE